MSKQLPSTPNMLFDFLKESFSNNEPLVKGAKRVVIDITTDNNQHIKLKKFKKGTRWIQLLD